MAKKNLPEVDKNAIARIQNPQARASIERMLKEAEAASQPYEFPTKGTSGVKRAYHKEPSARYHGYYGSTRSKHTRM